MKLRVTEMSALCCCEEMRRKDPDAHELLTSFYIDHGESVFVVRASEVKGCWDDDRFYDALCRLIRGGFMICVAETLH